MNNFENKPILEILGITKRQLRIFLCAGLLMFVMMSLQYLGVRAPINPIKLISPLPQNAQEAESDVMKTVRPKLEAKPNEFSLKRNPQLVGAAHAATQVENAAAYAVVDLDTGEIIAEKNGEMRLPIASITKVMTSVVALDLADPQEQFTVSHHAASIEPTKIGVIPGEKMSLEELLNGLMLVSGNDTAEVIREGINEKYGEKVFIDAMNAKAKFLGLKNSSFANPQGFDDPNNYSSVSDLAILAHYALANYPLLADIAKRDYHYVGANADHKQFDMYNWNGLLGVYPDAQGLKIGNTGDAGKTTIVTATRGGKKMAAVVLGAPRIIERDLWAAQLLDLGYERTLGLPPVNVTEEQLRAKYTTWQYWN